MSKVIRIACQGAGSASLAELHEFQGNLKDLSQQDYEKLRSQIIALGFSEPISVWANAPDDVWYILNGHQRLHTIKRMVSEDGYDEPYLPINFVEAENEAEAKRKVLSLTSQFGRMTHNGLQEFLEESGIPMQEVVDNFRFPDLELLPIVEETMVDAGAPAAAQAEAKRSGTLVEKFLVPPFSILDARQGYWKERKRQWLSMGIKSEVGRGDNLLGMSETMLEPDPEKRAAWLGKHNFDPEKFDSTVSGKSGTSIFDPVLCELVYRWFSPVDGLVIDPFAGGSVRGIVASKLGRTYIGGELREEQVEENRAQADVLCDIPLPQWICDDSRHIVENVNNLGAGQADLIFSCPPYADLEVYSEDSRDLSTLEYEEFLTSYRAIIESSLSLLKPNRFAVFVVGEVREKSKAGFYRNFVLDTVKAFEDAGARYYNEMILMTSAGTLALRAGRTFAATRKIGKTHQNVLVFCKGDPVKATEECGEVEILDLPENPSDDSEFNSAPAAATEYGEKLTALDIGGEV